MKFDQITIDEFRSNEERVTELRQFLTETEAGRLLWLALQGCTPSRTLANPKTLSSETGLRAAALAESQSSENLLGRIEGAELILNAIRDCATPAPRRDPQSRKAGGGPRSQIRPVTPKP